MSQDLNQDELNVLAKLLLISQKAKAREALCIKIGISYYKQLGFIYDSSSEDSFVINLISYLNDIGDTKAICSLCQELAPIFKDEKRESFLKEIAVKLNCNQEHRHNYQNPSIVELPTSPTPSPVPPLQSDGSKSQSKKLYWLTGVAIFLMGLAGFQIYSPSQKTHNIRTIVGYDSPGNDQVDFKNTNEEDCIKRCREKEGCVGVVISLDDNHQCWLKAQINPTLIENPSRTTIKF
jgi:hypothetical protein